MDPVLSRADLNAWRLWVWEGNHFLNFNGTVAIGCGHLQFQALQIWTFFSTQREQADLFFSLSGINITLERDHGNMLVFLSSFFSVFGGIYGKCLSPCGYYFLCGWLLMLDCLLEHGQGGHDMILTVESALQSDRPRMLLTPIFIEHAWLWVFWLGDLFAGFFIYWDIIGLLRGVWMAQSWCFQTACFP